MAISSKHSEAAVLAKKETAREESESMSSVDTLSLIQSFFDTKFKTLKRELSHEEGKSAR